MNQLYPIIRRKRRPLIQENPETLKAESLKPEMPKPETEIEPAPSGNATGNEKANDDVTDN